MNLFCPVQFERPAQSKRPLEATHISSSSGAAPEMTPSAGTANGISIVTSCMQRHQSGHGLQLVSFNPLFRLNSPAHAQILMHTLDLHVRLHPIHTKFSPNSTLFEPSKRRAIVQYHIVVYPDCTGIQSSTNTRSLTRIIGEYRCG